MDVVEELSIELPIVQALAVTIRMMQWCIDDGYCQPSKLAFYFGKHWTKTGELYCIPSPHSYYPDIYMDTKCGVILTEFALGEDGFYQTAAHRDGYVFYFPDYDNVNSTSHIVFDYNTGVSKRVKNVCEFRHGPYHIQENKVRFIGSYEDAHLKIENLRCDIFKERTVEKYWGAQTFAAKTVINHVKIINKKTGEAFTLGQKIPENFVRTKNGFYDRRRMREYTTEYAPYRTVVTYEQVIDRLAPMPYYPSHRTEKELNIIKKQRAEIMKVITEPLDVLSYWPKPEVVMFNAAEILEKQPSFDDIVKVRPTRITFGRK